MPAPVIQFELIRPVDIPDRDPKQISAYRPDLLLVPSTELIGKVLIVACDDHAVHRVLPEIPRRQGFRYSH